MPVLATTDATWVNSASVSYDAAELRRADAAIFASGGVASGLAVTVNASDVVTVAAGRWVIDGDSVVSGTGVYRGGIGAAASVALDARDATNSRIDLVVARQYDPDVVPAHTESKGKVEVITGTPAASPSAPALPQLAVELARITVPAAGGAAASVNTSQRAEATLISSGPKIVTGTVNASVTAATNFQQDVLFPSTAGFTSPPTVTLNFADGSPRDNWVSAYNETATGFRLAAFADQTKTLVVKYIAVGS